MTTPVPTTCNGCGKPLTLDHLYYDDGCPCNTPRGVNFKPRVCGMCRVDNCVKPGHHLVDVYGDVATGFAAPPAPAAPGDWMKSVTWLANAGHFLGGFVVIAIATMWSKDDAYWISAVTVFGLMLAAVKEYYIDLTFESDETVLSSTIDLAGYVAGAAVAWLNWWALHYWL
jgi:hypothetical protein